MDWVGDIAEMHEQYGFHEALERLGPDVLPRLLEFRTKFLEEELRELKTAESASDAVDALIDLVVVAIGTLDLFGVDSQLAWDRVHRANTSKEVGVKESRPNPLGLPDLVKPADWVAPDHDDNVGKFGQLEFPL